MWTDRFESDRNTKKLITYLLRFVSISIYCTINWLGPKKMVRIGNPLRPPWVVYSICICIESIFCFVFKTKQINSKGKISNAHHLSSKRRMGIWMSERANVCICLLIKLHQMQRKSDKRTKEKSNTQIYWTSFLVHLYAWIPTLLWAVINSIFHHPHILITEINHFSVIDNFWCDIH